VPESRPWSRPSAARGARIRTRVAPEVEARTLDYALHSPTHGAQRVPDELRLQDVQVSASGGRGVWLRHGLETRLKRLLRLEQTAQDDTIVLSETQLALLERHSVDFRCRHVEASRPGELRHRGEILGVIGPNGAGKSALLEILARVTRPTSGRAELHGRVSAILEADVGFHPELTGRENIALSGAILGMSRSEIARTFEAIVAMAGIEQFLDTPVTRSSSGMRVRLALAVATQLDSDIMLLDEVLAVGDEQFHMQCLAKLREMARAGRSVVIVSHDLQTIERLCARALHVSDGRMVADGASAQIVAGYLAPS
jgi:ABC-type polysaccharide/polyol phosphate transport system ATPase subunit